MKLYVSSAMRGTSVATILLKHAEQQLFQKGALDAELFCTAGNLRALRFYERNGWALHNTFEDELWLPADIREKFPVKTHNYRKCAAR